jgi:ribosome-binding protein aMBF1 (putative translation factor)
VSKKLQHINRRLTDEERQRLARIRAGVERDYPPPRASRRQAAPGIPAKIRAAREAQGLTWYSLAQRAGIPNQGTIRDIEHGKDVRMSNLQAVAEALGLELELVAGSSSAS